MRYSYSWLKQYISQIPEPKKLVELLTMRAFEVEGYEKIGDDYVLDIKVLPNRTFDCLSHIGMAREIAAIVAISNIQYPISKIKEDKSLKIKDYLDVKVEDKELCPRYSARVVVDVKVGESPKWMQERLVACGLRPINNIVDATNYVMLMTGQPMHAFDFEKIDFNYPENSSLGYPENCSRGIIVRRGKKNEKITTLEGEERELNEDILVIADGKDPIAIAGIKGGKKAEIDNKTSKIILESANFEPINVRKSARALNLRTDASIKFENGVDMNLTTDALNRAAAMIAELAGGKIVSGIADEQSIKARQISTAVAHKYIESLMGIEIKQKDILDIFKRLDLPVKIVKKKGDIFYEVFVPSRRNDLNTSEDLIEEIGRLYGYENIPAVMPASILIPALKNEELINEEKARNILSGAGYSEVYNYSLISEEKKNIFDFQNVIGPRYPLSNDQKYLRPTLIVRLLENIKDNLKYFDNARIFEIGKIFQEKEKNIEEKRTIAGALGDKAKKIDELFYETKGIVDLFLEKMGVANFGYAECAVNVQKSPLTTLYKSGEIAEIFNLSRRAKVVAGEKTIGWIGELNSKILSKFVIPAIFFELDFDIINELIEEEIEYKAPSKYPAIERDLSILVPRETRVDNVLNIIENIGGKLIINIDLEDMYEGERINENMKSLTFRLIFQSWEKTLTDAEINKITEKIIKAIEEEGWEIRS